MKSLFFIGLFMFAASAQAETQCLGKAEKAFAAVALLQQNLFIPKNPIEVLPETTALGGEGSQVPVENFRATVGDITSADVSMYKNGCDILSINIEWGE